MTDEINTTEREQVKHDLINSRLPELAEAGYIEWDREAQTIRLREGFDDVIPIFKQMDAPTIGHETHTAPAVRQPESADPSSVPPIHW